MSSLQYDIWQARQEHEKNLHAEAIREILARRDRYKVEKYFPNCLPGCVRGSMRVEDHVPREAGKPPTCRILYRPHRQFLRAGAFHRERLFLAANRIGKTEAAAFEIRAHMTGLYPKWWQGKRFDGPTSWWVAGDTRQTTRDIIQNALMGPHQGVPTSQWSGMLDPHLITKVVRASGGVANCLDTVLVEHVTRNAQGVPFCSELSFKSYDQGRRVFQGTEQHGIWLDEEPPDGAEKAESEAQGSSDIWTECLLRTMTTAGIVMATFTPLRGLTPFLKTFIETAWMPGTDGEDRDLDDGSDDFDGLLHCSPEPPTDRDARTHFYPDQLGDMVA